MTDRWTYADGKVFDGNGILLAHVVYDHQTNFRRNCRMIAAAPEMLAVLEKLSSLLVDSEEYVPLELREELTTAIRKARGFHR